MQMKVIYSVLSWELQGVLNTSCRVRPNCLDFLLRTAIPRRGLGLLDLQ